MTQRFLVALLALSALICPLLRGTEFESIVLGEGGEPKWSPSGRRLAVWQGESVAIYDADSLKLWKKIAVKHPWLYHWYNEDTLALYYKQYTTAPRVQDRIRIGVNGILPLDGPYREIVRDTASVTGEHLTPWQKLPDGTVGIFSAKGETLRVFMKFVHDHLTSAPADTTSFVQCADVFRPLRDRYEYVVSPDCRLAFAYRSPDQMAVILDSAGHELLTIGRKFTPLEGGFYRVWRSPSWSAGSNYVTLLETREDGHFVAAGGIMLVDVDSGSVLKLAEFADDCPQDLAWSPVRDEFVFVAPSAGSVIVMRRQK